MYFAYPTVNSSTFRKSCDYTGGDCFVAALQWRNILFLFASIFLRQFLTVVLRLAQGVLPAGWMGTVLSGGRTCAGRRRFF
jgi:hypothetical protein